MQGNLLGRGQDNERRRATNPLLSEATAMLEVVGLGQARHGTDEYALMPKGRQYWNIIGSEMSVSRSDSESAR